ncbi:hypothetical protein [Microbulbifer variabilis]|uniref:hypothetical protein n=1 Tax=Microbulbifer variabilis TaxID=266805 RepID=UPI001CFECFEC|nr:hypothetical protein [Microbulbifer variabilis]
MKNKDFLDATQGVLGRLGLSDTPPLISSATDTNSESHRRNCLAWYLLCTRSRSEVREWLKKQSTNLAMDMRIRLNSLRDQVREIREQGEG